MSKVHLDEFTNRRISKRNRFKVDVEDLIEPEPDPQNPISIKEEPFSEAK